MAQTALTTVQAAYAAFGRGDVAELMALLSPDVSWEVVGQAGAYPTFGLRHGTEGALAFFQAVEATESFNAFAPERFHSTRRGVTVEGSCFITLKTNGARLAYDWLHLWTVRDGKVTRFREFYDTALVVEAFQR